MNSIELTNGGRDAFEGIELILMLSIRDNLVFISQQENHKKIKQNYEQHIQGQNVFFYLLKKLFYCLFFNEIILGKNIYFFKEITLW